VIARKTFIPTCGFLFSLFIGISMGAVEPDVAEPTPKPAAATGQPPAVKPPVAPKEKAPAKPSKTAPPAPPAPPVEPGESKPPAIDPDDEAAVENAEAEQAAVARPVSPDLIQVYGWRENILIHGVKETLQAKLDTGALTSSIHAEEKELFERDGKKWVRFIVTDPGMKKPSRTRIEAPLVRIARVKEPGGESVPREVVRLSFQLGERKLRGEFTLNNRSNMISPVLIGRNMIKQLGWVDPTRTYLADEKIFR
jgi:hypothetical protein